MIKSRDNIASITLAVLLHVLLFGSLVVVLDFGSRNQIPVPLAINATLVTTEIVPPQIVKPPPPKPDPEPEPEPEPEPDTSEQERLAAEQQKREEDARIEQERLHRIEQEKAEAERKRIAEEQRRKREEEAEKERKRLKAEQERQAEIERQRAENERKRLEAEAAARQAELDAEAERVDAIVANAKAAYMFAIKQKITRNWVQPPSAEQGLRCTVKVQQLPGGQVVNVSFGSCNGDATVQRSIENAVFKASPLPPPRDPSVFDRNITLNFNTGE